MNDRSKNTLFLLAAAFSLGLWALVVAAVGAHEEPEREQVAGEVGR